MSKEVIVKDYGLVAVDHSWGPHIKMGVSDLNEVLLYCLGFKILILSCSSTNCT